MRPALILSAIIALSAPLHAQSGGGASGGEASADGQSSPSLSEVPAEEMMDAPVFASDDVEVGRVAGVIPAEDGIDSVIVDVSAYTGVGESSVAILPADLEVRREDGALRLVTTIDAATVEALAATSN